MPRGLVSWVALGLLALLGRSAGAVEYRFQVTHLDYRVFAAYEEPSTAPFRATAPMRRLEALLDQRQFPTNAVIPGREVQLLDDPGYGGTVPARLAVLPATRDQAWTTIVWEGHAGEPVAFVVKSDMVAWQEVWGVAANPEGTLRRLSLGGPALFWSHGREVPEVSQAFLATAAEQGTFAQWLGQTAPALDGLSLVVGSRRPSIFTRPDWVYVVITPPPEPRTFKLVLGWKDHNDRGTRGRMLR
jgi:hypothetical protein